MRSAALPLLLLVVGLLHWAGHRAQPEPDLSGDEIHYLRLARQDLKRGDTSLLPGNLRCKGRPELQSRILTRFLPAPEPETAKKPGKKARKLGKEEPPEPGVLGRIAFWQLGQLLVLMLLVHRQARLLGLGEAGAFSAAALLGTFPWLGFYVHALWPELLHASVFALALWALLAWEAGGRAGWLALGWASLGVALLVKGSLTSFIPVVALWSLAVSVRRADSPWRAAGLTCALVALPFLAITGPQLLANQRAGNGLRLSANSWWNIEIGVRSTMNGGWDPPSTEGPGHWKTKPELQNIYNDASTDVVEREQLARERTLAHLREAGFGQLPVQANKVANVFFWADSFFEQSLTQRSRWGETPPAWLVALRLPARVMWYALWVAGAAGFLLTFRRGWGWGLIAAYVLYALAGIVVIPIKTRFLIPMVPFLCLYAGALVDRYANRKAQSSPA